MSSAKGITLSPQSRRAAYFKMRMVGKGTYGSVHLVKCRDDDKLYVMKTVKNMTVEEGKAHQIEALREVKVLEQLKHPNIVGFVEAFLSGDQGTLYIVMEYAESGDLEKRIKSARRKAQYFSENQIIDWALQICLALKYLHDRKILHRDLKPQNVFLSENNKVVKLGDFGIVKVLEKTTAMAVTKVGTPYYFSPELCRNRPYSFKSDVWAVGVLTYQLMSLCVPFDARSMPDLIRKILNTRPPNPNVNNRYSQELCRMVAAMLAKSPDRRPTLEQILTAPCFASRLAYLTKLTPELVTVSQQEVAPGVTASVTTTKKATDTGHSVVTSVTAVDAAEPATRGAMAEVSEKMKEGYFDEAMQKLRAKQKELEGKIGKLQKQQMENAKKDKVPKEVSQENAAVQKEQAEKTEMKQFIEQQKKQREAREAGEAPPSVAGETETGAPKAAPIPETIAVATDLPEELEKTVMQLSEVCEEIHKMGAAAEEEKVMQMVAEVAQTLVASSDAVEPHSVVVGEEEVHEEDDFDKSEVGEVTAEQ